MSQAGEVRGELGPVIRSWQAEQQAELREGIERAARLLGEGLVALSNANGKTRDEQHVATALLWARCIEHMEALHTLARASMLTAASVILRALFEAVVTHNAICRNPSLVTSYIAEDDVQRRKLLRKLAKVGDPRFAALADPALLKQVESDIAKTGAIELSTLELAKMAGMEDWYNIVYALLTGPAHTKLRDLERHLVPDEAGELRLDFVRDDDRMKAQLGTGVILFAGAFDAFEALFGLTASRSRAVDVQFFTAWPR